MASAPVNAAFAALNRFFHKQKHPSLAAMHDDNDLFAADYDPFLHPHTYPANTWPAPQVSLSTFHLNVSDSEQDPLATTPAASSTRQPRMPSHRQHMQQQLPAIVTQPSSAPQPVLFDFDMDAEWHQSGVHFEAQQHQQQFPLNLSPASSFSSLSPTQVPLPLTPGIAGPPLTPLSTASMSPTSNNSTPSASTSLPNRAPAYPFPNNYVPHNAMRRTSTSSVVPQAVPSSPASPYLHQRHASANGYHPYAQNGRYQGPQQQQHRRSPLHQQQSNRSSPLGHQPGYVAEDFVDPLYMARSQGGYQVQQGYGQFEQPMQKQYQQQCYPPQQPQQHQQPRLSPSLYPSPPPSHPHLQHLQRVHIPAYTGPVGHGHGPRSASSSSTSSHVTSNSSTSSASSSYGPGTPLSVGSSSGSSFPSSSSHNHHNGNANAGGSSELLTEMMATSNVCVPDNGNGMVDQFQAAHQQHFVGLGGGMGIGGMGMDVDGMGVGVDPLEMEMDIGMGYMNPTQHAQPQQPQNASTAPPSQTTGISPQLVMLDNMPIHTHDQTQQISLFDDESSPIDAAYAEYAAAAAKESYVMRGVAGGRTNDDDDPRDQGSDANREGGGVGGDAEGHSSSLTQQRLEQHQQEEQKKAAMPEVTGVVQEWQRQGREYDSADSDSESEASDEDDEDYVEEGRQTSDVEGAKQAVSSEAAGEHQVGTKRGRKTSGAKGSTTMTTPTGPKSSSGTAKATAPTSKGSTRQAPSSFRRAVPTKRASTRTITPATIKTSRSRASTQTLTQKNVRGASGAPSQGKASAAVDMSDAEGEMDAEGDLDAEGEDDVEGVFGMDQDLGEADAVGEEDVEPESAEEEEDDEMSTDESSYDYDDDKDGEFVLRSRSRSRPSTSRPARRPAGESASGKRGAAGRTLRTRKSSATGSANGRYNPYSLYASEGGSGSPTTPTGSVLSSSIPGLRTLSATLASAGVNIPGANDGVPSSPTLSASSSLSSVGDVGGTRQRKTRPPTNLPVPVPVPNLTKKSRGRRVPTVSSLEELRKVASSQGESTTASSGRGRRRAGTTGSAASTGTKGARMYLCDVEGCGKCFARGEHLKRHVRSIHTNEKPHTCPYPGCGKDFSRHDNLGQHMRVHKDYVPPPSVKASS